MRLKSVTTYCFLFSIILLTENQIEATIKLPSIFSDNMVLQQNTYSAIWGTADTGEHITIQPGWQNKEYSLTADKNGEWLIRIKTTKAGGPYELKIQGKNKIVLKNILIGEVWLCSGQSNMFMPVGKVHYAPNGVEGAERELVKPEQPTLRLFSDDENPLWKNNGWQTARADTVRLFSAVGYYFAKALHRQLQVPIGVVNISRGGSPVQAWTPMDYALGNPVTKHYLELFNKHRSKIETYNQEKRNARLNNTKKPKPLARELAIANQFSGTSKLFDSLIKPVIPYSFKGIIWYQGEANGKFLTTAMNYGSMLQSLINAWRANWKKKQLPFYIVQLPCWNSPTATNWPWVRQGQLIAANSNDSVEVATICDFGNTKKLHPPQKQQVSERLARIALAKAYHKDIVYSGTAIQSAHREGMFVRVKFETGSSSVKLKNNSWNNLEIAGPDGIFHPAEANFRANEVIIKSDSVDNPRALRYGWDAVFAPSLFNEAGLPSSPFAIELDSNNNFQLMKNTFNISCPVGNHSSLPAGTELNFSIFGTLLDGKQRDYRIIKNSLLTAQEGQLKFNKQRASLQCECTSPGIYLLVVDDNDDGFKPPYYRDDIKYAWSCELKKIGTLLATH